MSEPTTAPAPDVGGFMNVWGVDYVDNCFQIAAFALCIYEYLVTLDLEITRVWGIRRSRKVSVVTLLFIVNRYACLCYVGSDLVQLAAWGGVSSATANKICNVTTRVEDLCEDVIYLGLALFTALRTYAIWDRNRKVFACVLVPGLVYPIGSIYINVVSTYRSRGTGTGCYEDIHFKFPADSDGPGGSRNRDYDVFYIVGRCVAILFECVALSLTWAKVIPVVRHLRRHNFSSTFILSRCFLYNGTIQFSVILLTTTFNLLGLLSPTAGDTAVFVTTLASILVSRFILDLRQDGEEQGDDDLRVPQFSNIDFAPGAQDPGDVEDSTIHDG